MRTGLPRHGQVPRRDEAAAKQPLFILTVQENNAHDQILNLANEELNFGLARTFGRREALPMKAVAPNFFERLVEVRQEQTPELIDLLQRAGLILAQELRLAFGQRKQLAAKRLVRAKVGQSLWGGVHG